LGWDTFALLAGIVIVIVEVTHQVIMHFQEWNAP
jgi:hypothetical protein